MAYFFAVNIILPAGPEYRRLMGSAACLAFYLVAFVRTARQNHAPPSRWSLFNLAMPRLHLAPKDSMINGKSFPCDWCVGKMPCMNRSDLISTISLRFPQLNCEDVEMAPRRYLTP
jgi:hypothetical protein